VFRGSFNFAAQLEPMDYWGWEVDVGVKMLAGRAGRQRVYEMSSRASRLVRGLSFAFSYSSLSPFCRVMAGRAEVRDVRPTLSARTEGFFTVASRRAASARAAPLFFQAFDRSGLMGVEGRWLTAGSGGFNGLSSRAWGRRFLDDLADDKYCGKHFRFLFFFCRNRGRRQALLGTCDPTVGRFVNVLAW